MSTKTHGLDETGYASICFMLNGKVCLETETLEIRIMKKTQAWNANRSAKGSRDKKSCKFSNLKRLATTTGIGLVVNQHSECEIIPLFDMKELASSSKLD